jgi:abequosyltransferase
MAEPRLSFCIPTYNFGQFIGQTLHNIFTQCTEEVEIVIVDGASTDQTQEVVRSFQLSHPNLTYHRREQNMGVDRDLAKAVELARGKYCWLMSSDDLLKLNAVSRILTETQLGYAVYLCNRTECDGKLRPIRDRLWLSSTCQDRVFDLSNHSELLDYFNHAQSLGALFSYISCIIVKRQDWNGILQDEALAGTNYLHVFTIFQILLSGGQLKYLKDPLVLCRGGNDSFANKGLLHRLMIDLEGYASVRGRFFCTDEVKRAFNVVMQRERKWYLLARIDKNEDRIAWKKIESQLLNYEYGRPRLVLLRVFSKVPLVGSVARILRSLLIGLRIFIYRHFAKPRTQAGENIN